MQGGLLRAVTAGALALGLLGAPASAAGKTDADAAPKNAQNAAEGAPEGAAFQQAAHDSARVALRRGQSKDVLRYWMLHNALEDRGQPFSPDEHDFVSLMWAALADAGLCHDGLPVDTKGDGVGLWPIATHNWLNKAVARQPAPPQPRSFPAFQVAVQQRQFHLRDVLSKEELGRIRFFRQDCAWPARAMGMPQVSAVRARGGPAGLPQEGGLDLQDRLSRAYAMRTLLLASQDTLDADRVRGLALLEARLFDLDMAIVRLERRKKRRTTRRRRQDAREVGLSPRALKIMRETGLRDMRAGAYAQFLRASAWWPVAEWHALRMDRQLALFRTAREVHGEDTAFARAQHKTLLALIDSLLERAPDKNGEAITAWMGFAAANPASGRSAATLDLTQGARGEALLRLGPETGFTERAVIALHRGVDALADGRPTAALRLFAIAMNTAEHSVMGDGVHNLAGRWFAYVLAQHEADDEVFAVLDTFVNAVDKNNMLEVLLWRAAFHVDRVSFERIARGLRKGGTVARRADVLRPLSRGDAGAMFRALRADAREHPTAALRFVKKLSEELAAEPIDVRAKHQKTLELSVQLLELLKPSVRKNVKKRMQAQIDALHVQLDALSAYDRSAIGRARSAAPGAPSYAGSVRLAPSDPLPWPFAPSRVQNPSPFSPIDLVPVEWAGPDGARVLGWQLQERVR